MKKQLKDICETITKGTTPTTLGYNYQETGINFVKIESISSYGMFEPEKFAHISDECNIALRRSQLKENDILFSIAGAIGRTAIVNKSILPANTNQALAIIRLNNSEEYNLKFLRYQLASEVVLRQTERQKQGVAQLNLSLKDIGNLELSLPSLSDQQKIATELDTIQSAIDNKKQQLSLLDEAVKSKFVEMFGENPIESGKWKVETLGEIGKVSMCKRILREQTTPEGDIPFYKIGTFGKKADAYISKELYNEFKSKYSYPKKGSILISASGTIGRAVVFDGEPAYFQDSNIVWIDNDETKVLNSFLQFWYGTNPWKITQGGTISRLYNSNISEANVIIPPLEVQQSFAAFVQQIDKSKFVVKQQIADLQELLDSKMQEYFGVE